MKLLVLFAAWAPAEEEGLSENSHRWLDYYSWVLSYLFKDDDVCVVVNENSHARTEEFFSSPNIISIERTDAVFNMNSDASAYQSCLTKCRPIIAEYDTVLFLHTKGISYDFASLEQFSALLRQGVLNRAAVAAEFEDGAQKLVAHSAHMSQSAQSINFSNDLARESGLTTDVVNFAATYSIYYVSARTLAQTLAGMPEKFLQENLESVGRNRFFFEGDFPSLLGGFGAQPVPMVGTSQQPGANSYISYDAYPAHNSAIVLREYGKWTRGPATYVQHPVPYLFGQPAFVDAVSMSFDI